MDTHRIALITDSTCELPETLMRREYAPLELLLNITGPVLGINTGPQALALCGYTEDEIIQR